MKEITRKLWGKVHHSHRGTGFITEACEYMNDRNPDPTSLFVEFKGDMLEVSKHLVKQELDADYLLELWMDASLYLTGHLEDLIPHLKRTRTLTGLYLEEKRHEKSNQE